MKRRALLASLGTVATGVAGCLADADSADGTPTGDPDPADGTPTGDRGSTDGTPIGEPTDRDVEPVVVDSGVETTATRCANGDAGDATVTFDTDGVTVDGLATTPTPCHEAVVEATTVETGELAVRLGFEPTGDGCVECVGAVEYTARVDLDGTSGVDTVVVDHGDAGGTHAVTRADATARPPGETPANTPRPPGETPADETPGAVPRTTDGAASRADPDLPVIVENRHDEDHAIQVTVVRESGATVHDETHDLPAESNRRVFDLSEADPAGIERFDVRAAANGQTDAVSVRTDACHGRVVVVVTPGGELDVTYSVC